jgi:4,5-DOPA dioxygenase extradiol
MERRTLMTMAAGAMGMAGLAGVREALGGGERRDTRMPALFVGHGSPLNAIQDSAFSRAWAEVGAALERPTAILCISAHWQTPGVMVTAMEKPRTIHDFYGFPDALHRATYPAPGSPAVAEAVVAQVTRAAVGLDRAWGLDHGTWSVFMRMFPRADVPVVQLSLAQRQDPAWHYALARELRPLRERGVLIVGSGNIVHNLRLIDRRGGAFDWAVEFDGAVAQRIARRDHEGLVDYRALGRAAARAVPTDEHYLPLLYALAVSDPGEPIRHFNDAVTMGSISMRSLIIG